MRVGLWHVICRAVKLVQASDTGSYGLVGDATGGANAKTQAHGSALILLFQRATDHCLSVH